MWQNSRQAFLHAKGDCEDHAILLADWLIEAGYDARVALGYCDEGFHAWVVLLYEGKEFVLEATTRMRPSKWEYYPQVFRLSEYRPCYQFNREFFWVNNSSETNRYYTGGSWELVSKFVSERRG
ncbi:MAG: transglutaminase domain-containing protein [Candidatus Omnitrophica bacterium]|nr:transglutaminase domain-containing protein [Candidatus Omnitrophota bacterium]